MKFKGDRLKELLLYPIELGQEKLRSQRGRPQLVEGALAEEILGRLGKLSEPYGTEIYIKDSVGIVKI
jgi:poly-gamma-glutamate synthesis protein (capsule biosynthesis protein)